MQYIYLGPHWPHGANCSWEPSCPSVPSVALQRKSLLFQLYVTHERYLYESVCLYLLSGDTFTWTPIRSPQTWQPNVPLLTFGAVVTDQ